MNSHCGLLNLAIDQQSRVDESIYSLPLYGSMAKRSLLPFQAVAETGDVEIAKILLNRLPQDASSLEEGLRIATASGQEAMVHLLLSHGVDIDAQDGEQKCALQIAIEQNRGPMRRLLLHAGASRELHAFQVALGLFGDAFLSPDGKLVASMSHRDPLKLWNVWNVRSGALLLTFPGLLSLNNFLVAFSPDGKLLALFSAEDFVRIFIVDSAVVLSTIKFRGNVLKETCVFSPDSKLLVAGMSDYTVRIWRTDSGALLQSLVGCVDTIGAVGFSPDSMLVITASGHQTIRIWNIATGTVVEETPILGYRDGLVPKKFSPDGKLLVLVPSNRWATGIYIWDFGSRALACDILVMGSPGDSPVQVAFSPDGKLLACSSDHVIGIWDLSSIVHLLTLNQSGNTVSAIAFSQDQTLLAVERITWSRVKQWDISSVAL
jgi:WD40 repeat protein